MREKENEHLEKDGSGAFESSTSFMNVVIFPSACVHMSGNPRSVQFSLIAA